MKMKLFFTGRVFDIAMNYIIYSPNHSIHHYRLSCTKTKNIKSKDLLWYAKRYKGKEIIPFKKDYWVEHITTRKGQEVFLESIDGESQKVWAEIEPFVEKDTSFDMISYIKMNALRVPMRAPGQSKSLEEHVSRDQYPTRSYKDFFRHTPKTIMLSRELSEEFQRTPFEEESLKIAREKAEAKKKKIKLKRPDPQEYWNHSEYIRALNAYNEAQETENIAL